MNNNDPFKTRIFRKTISILERSGIPFWIDSGTLLGLIRGQIPSRHRNRIDISIPATHRDRFEALKKNFNPFYRFKPMVDRSGRKWIPTDFPRIKIIKSWEQHRNASIKINVTFKYKKDEHYLWIDKRSCKQIEARYYDALDILDHDGMMLPVPSAAIDYLTARYGNWEEPQSYWISGIHDKAIVSDEIIKKIPVKKRLKGFKKKKKKIKLDGKYRARMKKIILKAIDILEKNNIPYWLDEGTLLGIIREGDLLPWDHDADFGVPGEYARKLLKIRYKFFPYFFVTKTKTKSIWLPDSIRSVKLKPPFERIIRINFHIDLFFKYKVDDSYHWIILNAFKHSSRKFFDKLDTILWEGRKVNIPSHVEEYLELNYGNWKVPDPDFDPSVDSGTIAEKGF